MQKGVVRYPYYQEFFLSCMKAKKRPTLTYFIDRKLNGKNYIVTLMMKATRITSTTTSYRRHEEKSIILTKNPKTSKQVSNLRPETFFINRYGPFSVVMDG